MRARRPWWAVCLLMAACVTPAVVPDPMDAPVTVDDGAQPPGAWSNRFISPAAYAHYMEARIHREGGRLDEALNNLALALAFDAESAYLHAYRALLLHESGATQEAEEGLAEALRLNAEAGMPWYVAARFAADKEAWGEAAKASQRAIELDPSLVEAYPDAIAFHIEHGDRAAAGRLADAMVQRWPLDPLGHRVLGELAVDRGDLLQATKHFERGVKLRPRSSASYHRLATVYVEIGELDRALETYVECTEARTGRPQCWFQRILVIKRQARAASLPVEPAVDRAVAAMAMDLAPNATLAAAAASRMASAGHVRMLENFVRGCVALRPELQELNYYLGLLHQGRHNRTQAIKAYAQVPEASRFFTESQTKRALLLSAGGRHRQAIAALDTAIGRDPELVDLRQLKAALYERAGQPRKALAALETALALGAAPGPSQLRHRVAELAWRVGRPDQARSLLEQLLTEHPDDVVALRFLAYILAEREEMLPRAETLAQRAVALRGDDAAALDSLAWVYYKRGRVGDAIRLLNRAVETAPRRLQTLEHLGDALAADGQVKAALLMYLRSLELAQEPKRRKALRRKMKATGNVP